jgi:hypothetical protein
MDDRHLLKRPEKIFSDPIMFTCTYEARVGNIGRSHQELTHVLGPMVAKSNGPVKALNSNFGHYCQPGYSKYLKKPKPATQKQAVKRQGIAPARVRQRKPQGDATCFNSALELTIIPDVQDKDTPAKVREILEADPSKYYAVKSFPTTGQTQVPGVKCPKFTDGKHVARIWARFLTRAKVGKSLNEDVTVVAERPILVNYKFELCRASDRIIVNLSKIVKHLQALKAKHGGLPFPIREIKDPQDSQNMSFKFVCPAVGPAGEKTEKKVRVNIFYRGKVNILGARDPDSPQTIYEYLAKLFHANWEKFVGIQPLPDTVVRKRLQKTRRPSKLTPKKTHVIPVENTISDQDLTNYLGELSKGARGVTTTEKGTPSKVNVLDILALASEFNMFDMFNVMGTAPDSLDDPGVDEVKGEDIEYYDKDPLNHNPK